MTNVQRGAATPQLVIGLAIMTAGLLMTVDILGLYPASDLLRYWPVVLIVLGVLKTTQSSDGANATGGIILTLLGCWLLLTTLHVLPARSWRLFWPLMLVMAGASLVLHTFRRATRETGEPSQTINIVGILGGGNRTSTANPFRGGDLFAIMGGGRVDLRQAVIPAGASATIDVFSMMGGFEIIVPETWAVDDRTTPVMGGMSNETRPLAGPPVATLILRGFLMMGGITVRN